MSCKVFYVPELNVHGQSDGRQGPVMTKMVEKEREEQNDDPAY